MQDTQDYEILATASRADERTRVVKHGESFAVFDHAGVIRQRGLAEQGIYHDGTRFLSTFEVALGRQRPLLLNSNVRRDNVLVIDLTNPDMPEFQGGPLERDTLHLASSGFLWEGAWYSRVRIHNYSDRALTLELSILFAADYADIFEVRGKRRPRRGHRLEPRVGHDEVVLGYEGLDGETRTTRLVFSPHPVKLSSGRAKFELRLAPNSDDTIEIRIACGGATPAALLEVDDAYGRSVEAANRRRSTGATLVPSSRRYEQWIERSVADIQMMTTDTASGPYPYAGVPWFSTPFGRDGILTSYEVLWCDPEPARGVLAFLAATQAEGFDRERDAEPGKIIHEVRRGEMAGLGEVPFGRYYGSVDATPLFVVLAGAYWRRTADRDLVAAIWPNIERALVWIDEHGDLDRDGFIEYSRRSSRGLVQQGWKDSHDSVSRSDGSIVDGAVALCEVQGYVYAARRAAAELARVLGYTERAVRLDEQAEAIREQFQRAFWCEHLGTYALALDGEKRPCEVRASNAGHCLWSGIASPQHAAAVVDTLLDEYSFSGWGVRTLDARELRYNPMSYHNGSVWPHDNAILAMGMSRYGAKRGCSMILSALFDASQHVDLQRMPELFCGFRQRTHEGPTLYPVACAPQAWAAGAVFLLLQACLGLDIDTPSARITFDHPLLPASLDSLAIHDLRVGPARLDLLVERGVDEAAVVYIHRREGNVDLVVLK
jgi:glycogen debranching enzyme